MVWLQTADFYADIRLPAPAADPMREPPGFGAADAGAGASGPLVGAWAFAGTAAWVPPRMSWEHRLDTRPAVISDAAVLDWDGPVLVEHGSMPGPGGPVPYIERWARLEGSTANGAALVGPRTIAVTSGTWRVTVAVPDGGAAGGPAGGPVHATLERRRGERWEMEGRVTPAASPPSGR